MAYSFSLCSLLKYTFSFQRASRAKSWNMTAKIAGNDARTSQVDQVAVVIVRPRLGTWSIVTSRVEGAKRFWSYNLCLTRLPVRRTFLAAIWANRTWFSVVCTRIDNDTCHHSGQNIVDSWGVISHNIWRGVISHNMKTPTRTWKCTRGIMQMSYLSVRVRLSFQKPWIIINAKTFANSLNMQKKYEKMFKKIVMRRTCCW